MCGFLVQVWLRVTLFVAGQNIGLNIEVGFGHLALQCGCSEGAASPTKKKTKNNCGSKVGWRGIRRKQ